MKAFFIFPFSLSSLYFRLEEFVDNYVCSSYLGRAWQHFADCVGRGNCCLCHTCGQCNGEKICTIVDLQAACPGIHVVKLTESCSLISPMTSFVHKITVLAHAVNVNLLQAFVDLGVPLISTY